MERRVYHILTNGRNGWKGVLEQTGRASVTGGDKQDVINRTIAMAKNHSKCSVVIHKIDGTIQEERTYPRSADPIYSKG
jgi:BioD-like phosphotransacetylase family protein